VGQPTVFVMGAGRSGTSILQSILSMHGRLVISHELRVLELAVLTGALVDNGGSPAIDERAPKSGFGLEIGKVFVSLLGAEQLRVAGKSGGVYGDKYPPYCEQISYLDRLWPAARFVHILRDGRDVVASALQAYVADRGWRRAPETPTVSALANNWAKQVRTARSYGASLPSSRYFELRYEYLCNDASATLAQLLRFIGLQPDEHHDAMSECMRPSRSWRDTLSRDDLDEFERCEDARELNLELGYEATPLQREAPRGLDADAWAAAGVEASSDSRAMACFVRAMRTPRKSTRAIVEALQRPARVESLFAAMNARTSGDADVRRALASWTQARGLDAEAARALFDANGGAGA